MFHSVIRVVLTVWPPTHSVACFVLRTLKPVSPAYCPPVAFGTVLEGMELVDKVCALPLDPHGRPLQPVTIEDCGELADPAGSNSSGEGSGRTFFGAAISAWFSDWGGSQNGAGRPA